MARRIKRSLPEHLLILISKLPWWLALAFAPASYFVLHTAEPHLALSAKVASDITNVASSTAYHWLVVVGQYVLPFFFVLGAVVSFITHKRGSALYKSVANSNATDALTRITWQQFEVLVSESFRRQGYDVEETGGGGADGGVDLVLTKSGRRTLVQCKQWKASIGVPTVRELYGVMAAEGVKFGIVVTSGRFTEPAIAFAQGKNLELIDGASLLRTVRGRTQ